jgi:hypothetical protein
MGRMKEPLIVSRGNKVERFPFGTDVIHLDRESKISWCKETFDTNAWYWFMVQRIYFKKKKDLAWFNVRWGL